MAEAAAPDQPVGKPLAGVRIVDLTRVMSGPFCTAMLADLGAEVIKVEPLGGDIVRVAGGHMRNGETGMFLALNRGKKSLSVDLNEPAGREAVARLAATADVFVENFRPGVADAMHLDAATLRAANERLVYVSINGYGRDGKMAREPAYDTVIQGQTGMVARQRSGDGINTVRSYPIDKLTGLFASQAILAALLERERTGRGAMIDVPMFDASIYYLWSDVLTEETFVDGDYTYVADTWRGQGVYETADRPIVYLAIAVKEHHGVFRAIGRHDLVDDERFATVAGCIEHGEERRAAVVEGLATMTAAEAVAALRAEQVAATVVLDGDQVVVDEALIEPGFFVEWDHPVAGRLRQPRHPARFNRVWSEPSCAVPGLGEHTDELLAEIGYQPSEIEQLTSARAKR